MSGIERKKKRAKRAHVNRAELVLPRTCGTCVRNQHHSSNFKALSLIIFWMSKKNKKQKTKNKTKRPGVATNGQTSELEQQMRVVSSFDSSLRC